MTQFSLGFYMRLPDYLEACSSDSWRYFIQEYELEAALTVFVSKNKKLL